MAAGRKGKTNATQVAIRDHFSLDSDVLIRVNKGSEIEVENDTTPDSEGNLWSKVAYGYSKLGYMMRKYIDITDSRLRYYMIETLEAFGNKIWVRGDSDLSDSGGPIYNIQVALNKLYSRHFDDNWPLEQVGTDGIFGPATESAVKAAQNFMGCGVDGKVGPETKARLYYCAYDHGGWPLSGDPNA